ncbi:MAG: ABC transporter permease [Micropruina sp.]
MREVVATEFWKLRRSGVPLTTACVIVLAVLGAGLLTWIVRDPERAASLGLLGTKANLAGLEATWPAFGSYLAGGAGGMLLLAFIVTFLVGREYEDDTSKNMLGLPVPRWQFLIAKLAVAAVWWTALVALLLVTGLIVALALDLPGLTVDAFAATASTTLLAAAASFLLAPVSAWITVATRSYLAASGFALGMLLLGNLLGHTGWATWFPWSIVPMLTLMSGSTPVSLPWTSALVLGLTFAGGIGGAIQRLSSADNP